MKNMTVRLEKDEIEELEKEAKKLDESRSEYVRQIIRNRDSTHSALDSASESAFLREALSRLEGEIERLHEENNRLTRQLEADPVPAVEDGKETSLLTRAKSWMFGRSEESAD
ncbi:ribbon-helix-helix protein, CopG family [Haladaptatus sp. DYF46]|uniref:ribbon-helix-helix protein, CopG family n=1 Tax=Haladaptatus sp. DYF46 TaxID=2886041 RepID=UPI001E45466D|nr:ribbon-helix-helix protein, CopG family [Haladaptatus sp. DYF46]